MIRRSVIFSLFLYIGISCLLNGCNTDVDLLAPYKSTPVIVGILDYTADTQFVRINRTYLGSGDANAYAKIKDSVEYDPSEVEAILYKKRNGTIQDSIELKYIEKPSRDPGVFYDQNVGFYFTDESLFTPEEMTDIRNVPFVSNPVKLTYALKVTARGKTYRAETNFSSLTGASITPPVDPTTRTKLQLYQESFGTYTNKTLNFHQDYTTARYQGVFRIVFDYSTTDGTRVENQFIDFKLGEIDNTELQNGNSGFVLTTQNWYNFIGQKFSEIPNLKKVRIEQVEYRITGANEDLNTYYKIANPVSDFTPVLNTFSNLDNGAIGILGSRTTVVDAHELSDPSMKIMNEGEYTVGFCYCDNNWSGSEYVCTDGQNNCP